MAASSGASRVQTPRCTAIVDVATVSFSAMFASVG
jgi:hypothetical protein